MFLANKTRPLVFLSNLWQGQTSVPKKEDTVSVRESSPVTSISDGLFISMKI